MDREVRYHPLFHCDVVEAANWYNARSEELGDAFVANVKSATLKIIADPDRFALTELGLRYLRVERFPYIVLFELLDERLYLIGVVHPARSIEKWRDKRR